MGQAVAETIADPTRAEASDRWFRLPASWETYLRLLADRGERSRPRYIFVDGRLTAVSPGVPHESLRKRVSGLLELLLEQLDIPATPAGSVTLLREADSREGVEADDAYYLTNLDALKGTTRLVMGADPPPDLVVEVVVSHPEDDALEAYRRFGVREVWVVKPGTLTFLTLGDDGRYRPAPVRGALPFLASDELAGWVFREADRGETRLRRAFRAWVEETLAPRTRPNPD